MGRRARQFSLSDADRAELERISRSRTEAKQRVDRAKIILGCCDGEAQTALAQRLGTRPNTVSKWRSRFARLGLKGLVDAPPPGKPERYVGTRTGAENRGDAAPEGQARWDGLSLAKVVGAKKSTVYNVLRKEGVQLQRMRSWCVSTDPDFAAKAADIIRLCLQPPTRAEKPSIQALSRTTGYVQTSSGKVVRGLKSTYRRNGTLNLFAALNVATGEVIRRQRRRNPSRLPGLHGRSRQRCGTRPGNPRNSRQLCDA